MEDRDKHKLEGLLKARSEDMGRRRPRHQRPADDPTFERPKPPQPGQVARPATRECGDCGGEIQPRRVRAMPSATRCLDCQRAVEQAHGPS